MMNSLNRLCRSLRQVSLHSLPSISVQRLFVPVVRRYNHECPGTVKSSAAFSTLPLLFKFSLCNSVLSTPTTYTPQRAYRIFSFKDALTPYLKRYIDKGPPKNKPTKLGATEGRPFLKGVVLKTIIRKPKKPNSANRKCVRVKLSTGREATAYVPGIGHNLQEHHTVLVRGGRVQDLPGVKLKCVRGKYDLAHVKKA